MRRIAVSVIEDDPGTLSALGQLLDAWPALLCASLHRTAGDALRKLPRLRPDIILADLELKGESGINCIRQLKADLPATPILVYTRYDTPEWLFPALQAGASGYIVKDGDPSELLNALLATHRGEAPMSSQVARNILAYFRRLDSVPDVPKAGAPRSQSPAARAERLSAEEESLMELLAKGCTNKDAAHRLKVSPRTVAYRLELIRHKLHAVSRVNAVAEFLRQNDRLG